MSAWCRGAGLNGVRVAVIAGGAGAVPSERGRATSRRGDGPGRRRGRERYAATFSGVVGVLNPNSLSRRLGHLAVGRDCHRGELFSIQ